MCQGGYLYVDEMSHLKYYFFSPYTMYVLVYKSLTLHNIIVSMKKYSLKILEAKILCLAEFLLEKVTLKYFLQVDHPYA